MSTISVVIPCYNAGAFIAEAIASVLTQTRRPLEIVVVDDASTDASAALARQAGARVLVLPQNRGGAAARNAGIHAARGELIAFLDADDTWEPHHLETVGGLLDRHPGAAVAFGATRRFGLREGVVHGYVPEGPPALVFWQAFDDWLHTMIGSVVRRAALLEIGGFDETERVSIDYDLWLRLARRYRFVCTHEVTSNWRCHEAQISQRHDVQLRAKLRFQGKLWQSLRDEGDDTLASEVAARLRNWLDERLRRAWHARDQAALRFHASLIRELPPPILPARFRWRWRVAARLPTGMFTAWDRARAVVGVPKQR